MEANAALVRSAPAEIWPLSMMPGFAIIVDTSTMPVSAQMTTVSQNCLLYTSRCV